MRLRIIGDRTRFAADIQARMAECETLTADNRELNLSVAVNFGGRWDIVQAARSMVEDAAAGRLRADEVDESRFANYLSLANLPEPDLLIRTGGEHRISNFLLWDLAYAEFYFTDAYWPDFDRTALREALHAYAQRQRRFGRRE